MSDHKGARLVLDVLPPAKTLIADRGYDSKIFREALQARGIEPCIPSSRSRKVPYPYDKALYKKRHKVENLFAKLKDWRRIATRYGPLRAYLLPQEYASQQPSASGSDLTSPEPSTTLAEVHLVV